MKNIVILGGLGDLTSRYLVPAIAELIAAGRLPPDIRVVGAGRADIDDERYREHVREALTASGAERSIAGRFSWARTDATSERDLGRLLAAFDGPVLVYLALPPSVAKKAVRAIDGAGARSRAHVIIEKPFGRDLASAKDFNALLAKHCDERNVHRIDHFLGLQSLRSLVALRAANPTMEAALSGATVARVEIRWDETLALEGRASYYDGTGALRDMVQNHLLQVLAAIALEPPASLDDHAMSRARLEVLRHTRTRPPVVRAQYGAGSVEGRPVRAYADEEGTDRERHTETFVRIALEVDTPRWRGVPFVIRTGKALDRDSMQLTLVFRSAAGVFAAAPEGRLTVGLEDGTFSMTLALASADGNASSNVLFVGRGERPDLSPYARVLDDALHERASTSVSAEEVEAQWAVVQPVLDAFDDGILPLLTYPAGSAGPEEGGGDV